MTIDWDKPIALVEASSGVAVPTAEPSKHIGTAAGQPYYIHAVRALGKVYLVAHDGEIQGYPEFRIRNARESALRQMALNDALRLDLTTLAQHGNTVVLRWSARAGAFVAGACKSTDAGSVAFIKHCEYRGDVVTSASLDDAVGHLHDIVMDERHEQHGH